MNREEREKQIAFLLGQALNAQALISRPDVSPESEQRAINLFQVNMQLIAELRNESAAELALKERSVKALEEIGQALNRILGSQKP